MKQVGEIFQITSDTMHMSMEQKLEFHHDGPKCLFG